MRTLIALAFSTLLLTQAAPAITAFQARDLANHQVNDKARNQVVQILGEKTSLGLTPVEWKVLFWDPLAEQDGTLVTVAGNTVTKIQDGYTQMGEFRMAAYKMEEIIDPKGLKIDSDAALAAVQRNTTLRDVKLTSVSFFLRKEDTQKPLTPGIWFLDLYAQSAKDKEGKSKEIKIGKAKVSADTGQVIGMDVDLKKLGK
jgi:hypothetical protein